MNQVVYTNKRRIKRYNHIVRFIFWHINVTEWIHSKKKIKTISPAILLKRKWIRKWADIYIYIYVCVLEVLIWSLSIILIFYFGTVPTVWYFILELFRQCDILFWNCSDSVIFYFGTVPTVWYFISELFRQCDILFRNCSDSVICLCLLYY